MSRRLGILTVVSALGLWTGYTIGMWALLAPPSRDVCFRVRCGIEHGVPWVDVTGIGDVDLDEVYARCGCAGRVRA